MGQNYQGWGKCKPQKTENDGYTFDSLFESEVYDSLITVIPKERILVHHSIKLLDGCDDFPELRWKCDFAILSPDGTGKVYIEAKGLKTDVFRLTLRLIRHSRPDVFRGLMIIMAQPNIKFGKTMKSFSTIQMRRILLSLERTEWKQ